MSEFEAAFEENPLNDNQREMINERINHISNYLLYGTELYDTLDVTVDSEQEIDQLHRNLFYQTDFTPSKFNYRASRVATSFEAVSDLLESQNLIEPLFNDIIEYDDDVSEPVDYLIDIVRPLYKEDQKLNDNELGSLESTLTAAIDHTGIDFRLSYFLFDSPQDIVSLLQQLADEVRNSSETYRQVIDEIFRYSNYLPDGGSGDWDIWAELRRAISFYSTATLVILAIMYSLISGNYVVLFSIFAFLIGIISPY